MFADLARRGLSHPNTVAYYKRAVATNAEGSEWIDMPTWGVVMLCVSFIVAMIFVSLVSYILNEVITTLCIIESPVAAITISPSTHESGDKEKKEGLLETGPTITLVHQRPITSSIRGTIKHLVAHAGHFAHLRGFWIHVLYATGFSMVSSFLTGVLPRVPGQAVLVAGLSGAALANLHASWTHKVVSMPNSKTFWQRIPSKSQWKTLALPAAINAAMPYISVYLACGVAMLMGLHKLDQENVKEYNGAQWTSLILRMILIFVFAISCTLFLCLPAIVTLVRIEASILPEDQDTIIPFDRTFGGKAVSQIMGGTGKIGFLNAWRSFNWEARRRLIKLFVKVSFILMGFIFIIVHVFVFEVFLVEGPALGKFLSQVKAKGWAQ